MLPMDFGLYTDVLQHIDKFSIRGSIQVTKRRAWLVGSVATVLIIQ